MEKGVEMDGLTKVQKRRLKALASVAHERELSAALTELVTGFSEWRDGKIGSFELDDHIHAYKKGPARDIWTFYATMDTALAVARGLGHGILEESEVDESLRALLARQVEFFRSESD